MNDQTENTRRLQERLERVERRNKIYEAILHATTDGFLVVDKDGIIQEINKAYCDFYAVKAEEIIGQPVHKLIANSEMLNIMASGRVDIDVIHMLHKNQSASGERMTATTRVPVSSDSGEVIGAAALVKFSNYTNKLVKSLRELGDEMAYYKKELMRHSLMEYTFDAIPSKNAAFRELKTLAARYARNDLPILLQGETGVGKEVFANAVHNAGSRRNGPFICVNCASIPSELLESELFGYEGGAYTGSRKGGKKGKLEMADKGTLLLDEIGDMPLHMQAKLLRVLQDNVVEKVGSERPVRVDVRILSATNKNLEQMIQKQQFREDLYYRLNVLLITIPPLREHAEDIPALANRFIDELRQKYGRRMTLSDEAAQCLQNYSWPGNIRELKNAVGRAFMTAEGSVILLRHLSAGLLSQGAPVGAVRPFEVGAPAQTKEAFLEILEAHNWNCRSAANALGVHRATIYNRMKQWDISIHDIRNKQHSAAPAKADAGK